MPAYVKRIIGAALGVAAALMMLYMGFWKGLLVIVLGLVGFWLTGERKIPAWCLTLIEKIKNRNGNDM